nr:MAG TPA: hypothetical protein [Caudoviricetes sp.]
MLLRALVALVQLPRLLRSITLAQHLPRRLLRQSKRLQCIVVM